MAAAIISVRGLVHAYHGKTILSIPELDVEPGAVLTLLGPNGSGKSTLLRLLGLLELPLAGHIAFRGQVPGNGRERLEQRRRMAMVFQSPLLFKGTVYDNVAYGLRLRGLPHQLAAGRVQEALELVGLSSFARRDVAGLSGGEAQKAALARALVLRPEILFLDEPTAYLDALARQGFCAELLALLDALHITAVFVTHDRNEARRVSRTVAVLMGGKLEQLGPVEEVFRRPSSPKLAGFLGVENLFPAEARSDHGCTRLRAGELELVATQTASGAVTVGLRPQALLLNEGEHRNGNVLTGTIRQLIPQDTAFRLEIDCGLPLVAYLGEQEVYRRGLGPGQVVKLWVAPEQILVYPANET